MLAALIIVVCVMEPGEPERCGIEHRVPVAVTMQECMLFGQRIALDWMAQFPVLEWTQLTGWRCETGERT
jgi:hypothetical protein